MIMGNNLMDFFNDYLKRPIRFLMFLFFGTFLFTTILYISHCFFSLFTDLSVNNNNSDFLKFKDSPFVFGFFFSTLITSYYIIFLNPKPRLVFDKIIDFLFEIAVKILGKLLRN